MYYAIHIKAENDRNGNPRRAFLLYDAAGNFVGCANEGYRGNHSIAGSGLLPDGATVKILAAVPTTAGFVRDCLRAEVV